MLGFNFILSVKSDSDEMTSMHSDWRQANFHSSEFRYHLLSQNRNCESRVSITVIHHTQITDTPLGILYSVNIRHLPKRSVSKNKSSTYAKLERSQQHTMMDKNHSAAEDHTTNETTTNSLSKQFHTQIGEQTTKETSDYTITHTHTTIHTGSESTVDKKHAVESVEDLERRLN